MRLAVEIVAGMMIPIDMNVDSYALHSTITPKDESNDFRVRQAVQAIHESFEWGEISRERFISGRANHADQISKRNSTTGPRLKKMLLTRRL